MFNRIIFIFSLSILFTSCESDSPTPSVSQIFNCSINGELWSPTNFSIKRGEEDSIRISANNAAYQMTITGNHSSTYFYDLAAYSNQATVVDLNAGSTLYTTNEYGSTGKLYIDTPKSGDAANTLSGTFSFNAKKLDEEIITVTNGKFSNIPFTE